MNCKNHPTRTAINTCNECGDWLCEECTAEVGGRVYCTPCLQKKWNREHEALSHHSHHMPPHHPHYAGKHVNWGLLFIFSMLPGLNYMYEGLIKRGLFAMTGFLFTSYLAGMFEIPLVGILAGIMWIGCAFDGFRIRNLINGGVDVTDNVDDILGFVRANKTAVVLFVALCLGLGVLNRVMDWLHYGIYDSYYLSRMLRMGIPVVLMALGLYFIINSGKKVKPPYVDHTSYPTKDSQSNTK